MSRREFRILSIRLDIMVLRINSPYSFSISKWIHLNNGDAGLLTFFQRVHSVLGVGGTFVLEPQEWDTYAKAKRMDIVCLFLCAHAHI